MCTLVFTGCVHTESETNDSVMGDQTGCKCWLLHVQTETERESGMNRKREGYGNGKMALVQLSV